MVRSSAFSYLRNISLIRKTFAFLLVAAAILAASVFVRAQTSNVTVRVIDEAGSALANAAITLTPASGEKIKVATRGDGTFELPANFEGTLTVEAAGFSRYSTRWNVSSPHEIVLKPLPISATVNITGSEIRIDATAASVVALDSKTLDITAASTVDDKLRQVPGFSLFRRAGSRTANPTTQGVSLRGIGASGASRALVVADGIPLNDPFGGWIYWGRVPTESIRQIEVLRGSSSDLYGSSAIGGVISILTKAATVEPTFSAEASYGSQDTPSVSVFASAGYRELIGSLAVEAFRTDGFITVAPADRGRIDTAAGVSRWTINPYLEWKRSENLRLFASAGFYNELRRNGTPQQNNDTRLRRFAVGADVRGDRAGSLAFRLYGGPQLYHQSFTAIAADRTSEALTRLQTAPARVVGGSARWAANFGTRNLFTAGFEARRVSGRSDETAISAGRATSQVSAGGTELSVGGYAGVLVPILSRLTISGGLRFDRWQESSGVSSSRSLSTGVLTSRMFPDRSESAVSPRVSVLYKLREAVSLFASYSTGFRQPTLNELYRAFRVGDIVTLANENLRAEHARNFEGGFNASGLGERLYIRSGVFCTTLSRPVANRTLSVTPSLITRQRQNLGQTRSCGVESDGQFRVTREITASAGYLFVDSRVTDFPPDPSLENLRVPQIARHQFSAQFQYSNAKIVNLGVQFRAASGQFDDDQNRIRLRGYSTLDAFVSRRLGRYTEVFAAIENAFDSEVESGRTPVLTLAIPRSIRVGIRLRFR